MATTRPRTPRKSPTDRWMWMREALVEHVDRARIMLAGNQAARDPIVWMLYDLVGAARLYSLTEYADLNTEFHNAANLDDHDLWLLLGRFVTRFDTLEPGLPAAA